MDIQAKINNIFRLEGYIFAKMKKGCLCGL